VEVEFPRELGQRPCIVAWQISMNYSLLHSSKCRIRRCRCLWSLATICLCSPLSVVPQASAAIYYVDTARGSDSNSGVNPRRPWQTLEKVNATTFAPGDHILFCARRRWSGKLHPKGSGAPGKPIIIDRYGEGALPVIDGAGSAGDGVIWLYNQQYWEIENLEITNDAPTGADRRGVMVAATNGGTIHHVHLRNLYIHHIKGIVGQSVQAKIAEDPRFVGPGGGGIGLGSLDGYKLRSDSPCIDSGKPVPQSVPSDFWGNPVPHAGGAVDRGVHEYPGP
jgi:hypothetical protein